MIESLQRIGDSGIEDMYRIQDYEIEGMYKGEGMHGIWYYGTEDVHRKRQWHEGMSRMRLSE